MLKTLPKWLLQTWQNYWFRPTPLFNLAVCRIIIVGYQLIHMLRDDFWARLVEYSALPQFLYEPLIIIQIFLAPLGGTNPPLWLTGGIFGLTAIAGATSVLGLWTRVSLVIFTLGSLFIQGYLYSFRDFHHSEALVMISLILLCLGPAGAVLSIDDIRRRTRRVIQQGHLEPFNILNETSVFAGWPMKVLQWIFALVYLDSALSKLSKGGLEWMNGYTLQYYLWQDGLIWDRPLGIWLAHQHELTVISSWVAMIFELTFFLVLIFPRLAWIYLPLGAAFHTGIYIAQKAPFIKYVASYSVFIGWSNVVRFLYSRSKPLPVPPTIIYTPESNVSLQRAVLLRYFDWGDRLSYQSAKQISKSTADLDTNDSLPSPSLQLLKADGSLQQGQAAFEAALRYIPCLWPLQLCFRLPGVSAIAFHRKLS
jgi:hypothetical protein